MFVSETLEVKHSIWREEQLRFQWYTRATKRKTEWDSDEEDEEKMTLLILHFLLKPSFRSQVHHRVHKNLWRRQVFHKTLLHQKKVTWFSKPSKARACKTYLQNNEIASRKVFVAFSETSGEKPCFNGS